ncbi:hypothetical protein F183_A13860 [Bryobacterales bacterium F-183]|nr:hypothetical protein F183_A13860 [Bryobacterales bacterium F-183]
MKFLIDNQLPFELAKLLASRSVECVHVRELGMEQTSDSRIWNYAAQHQYIIVSKDQDFRDLVIRTNGQCQMVWIRTGNCRVPHLLDLVSAHWDDIVLSLQEGQTIVELRN